MRKSLSSKLIISTFFLLIPVYAFAQTSLNEIIPRVKKGLVTVQSRERPERQGQSHDPYFYFFKQPLPAGRDTFPLGSGFVMPDGKHIATSARSLENLSEVEVVTDDQKTYRAKLVGVDLKLDLALLALEGTKRSFSGLDFGDSKQSRIGDRLYMFGRSLKFVVVQADLSSTDAIEGPYGRHWTIDRPTSPAVAGGPLLDTRGRVVGMAVFNARGPEHLGSVLPAHLITLAAKQLITFGKPQRAWLGIVPRAQVNIGDLDHIHEAKVKGGILVDNLIIDGPAAKAGLQIGDFIQTIDGKKMSSISELFDLLDRKNAGGSLTLSIYRASKGVMELKLTLGELPNARELPNTENLL